MSFDFILLINLWFKFKIDFSSISDRTNKKKLVFQKLNIFFYYYFYYFSSNHGQTKITLICIYRIHLDWNENSMLVQYRYLFANTDEKAVIYTPILRNAHLIFQSHTFICTQQNRWRKWNKEKKNEPSRINVNFVTNSTTLVDKLNKRIVEQ